MVQKSSREARAGGGGAGGKPMAPRCGDCQGLRVKVVDAEFARSEIGDQEAAIDAWVALQGAGVDEGQVVERAEHTAVGVPGDQEAVVALGVESVQLMVGR